MAVAAPHRGNEVRVVSKGRTVLAITRSPGTDDASVADADGIVASFTGVLDNQAELDARLSRSPDSAAGTVAAAFRAWGDAAPARMRGTFAGAVVDEKGLRLFRDHFGTKPLFAREDARGFYAATEIKQVCAGAGIAREPDPEGLEDILYGTVGDRTAISGVTRVGRGSMVHVNGAGPTQRRYWEPSNLLETSAMGVTEAGERIRELLERAVRRSVTAGAAVLLSGGLDSPTIAAFAAPHHRDEFGTPLRALSAAYPEHPSVDETERVALVAADLGLELTTYVPRAGVLDDVERWVDLADGPTDTLSLPQAAEAYLGARAVGADTVLTGEMAEYVFELRHYLLDHLLAHGRFGAAGHLIAAQRRRGRRWKPIVKDLARAILPPRLATAYVDLRGRDGRRLPAWIDPHRVGGGTHRPDLARPPGKRWSEMQIAPFIGAAYTFEADEICAASCGVTIRWPFADIDLWEFVLSLRAEVKYPDLESKSLVRRAMRGLLPSAIVDNRAPTTFDEYSLSKAEYSELRRLLIGADYRVAGIDYAMLADRIERAEMDLVELSWARDLARVHAFVRVRS